MTAAIAIIWRTLVLTWYLIFPAAGRQQMRELESAFQVNDCEKLIQIQKELAQKKIQIGKIFNLQVAECLINHEETKQAEELLKSLKSLQSPYLASVKLNHEARIAAIKGDTATAINQLMMAIEKENNNNFAKYNLEYLKRKYKPNSQQPPSGNAANQPSPTGGITDMNDTDKPDILNSTSPPEIDRSQALLLLDALKANELNNKPLLLGIKENKEVYGEW